MFLLDWFFDNTAHLHTVRFARSALNIRSADVWCATR